MRQRPSKETKRTQTIENPTTKDFSYLRLQGLQGTTFATDLRKNCKAFMVQSSEPSFWKKTFLEVLDPVAKAAETLKLRTLTSPKIQSHLELSPHARKTQRKPFPPKPLNRLQHSMDPPRLAATAAAAALGAQGLAALWVSSSQILGRQGRWVGGAVGGVKVGRGWKSWVV